MRPVTIEGEGVDGAAEVGLILGPHPRPRSLGANDSPRTSAPENRTISPWASPTRLYPDLPEPLAHAQEMHEKRQSARGTQPTPG